MRLLAMAALMVTPTVAHAAPGNAALNADIEGVVTDSSNGNALEGAEVAVSNAGQIVAIAPTDKFGRFVIHNVAPGQYAVFARLLGFRPDTIRVSIGVSGAPVTVDFHLVPAPVTLSAVTVNASTPIAVDTRSGDQVFKQDDYHGAPTNTTSQILQQSIAGAARAPTGEVHIRGQHAEYTYYIDGITVPSGISGSLNELFDPSVANRIDFQTGGWDAEFGDKNAAIVNVQTKIPSGGFHLNVSGYGGSFDANGESVALSANSGKWGYFVSGTRQATDMRQEPVAFDTTTFAPLNYHNDGTDYFTFAKVQYQPSDRNTFALDMNWAQTHFAVPYDSTGGVIQDDHQTDVNAFINLGWNHRFGSDTSAGERGAQLFGGFFFRYGSLDYVPGAEDTPSFIFYPDTTPYNLSENRSFQTYGVKLDYLIRTSEHLEFKFGTLASLTRGQENFTTTDAEGNAGPASNSPLDGHDIGVYGQAAYSPTEWFELRAGLRYDSHVAPFAGNQTQLSPRIRLNFFPDPSNSFYLYYGRLFIPTNIEDLRAITSVADSGVAAEPTLPERDDFFEAGYIHRFPLGIVTKLSGYYKSSNPGIDDNTVPGSAIVTSVNIDKVRITGIEAVIEVRPSGPFSGYVNFALNHAYGHGPVTGGFFPTQLPPSYFDLDHDQRISVVASALYSEHRLYIGATGIYGTGLTNGVTPDPSQPQLGPYGTGLFDFNSDYKVKPSFILNLSAGYSFVFSSIVLRPELFVDNAFDHKYLLKGAFFSGASVGRPRTVQLRLTLAI